jgi:glycosyltransferase involved in cell wall biosynthesis
LLRSLSVLLPVRNVQATLDSHVAQILEIAGDLAERVELLILDDGSSDYTVEVAHHLAMRYPQVRVIRSGQQRGFSSIIEQGLTRATGDVVLFHTGVGAGEPPACTALEPLVGLHHALPEDVSSRQSPGIGGDGWQAVAGEELAAVRLRADQKSLIKTRAPNFLAKLRELAWGE